MTRKSYRFAFCAVPLVILLCFLFAGCGCKHQWQAADCNTPKTCSLCQITEGEALGHSWADASCAAPKTCSTCNATEGEALAHTWVDATCSAPKTCSLCKLTEGEALPHTWVGTGYAEPRTCSICKITYCEALGHPWIDADCDDPKICKMCDATEGEPLGHTWTEATCKAAKTCTRCKRTDGYALPHKWLEATTSSPKVCTQCGKTTGYRIMTDSRFHTAHCKDLFGTWKGTLKIPGNKIIGEGFDGTLEVDYAITFKNDGYYKETNKILNKEQFIQKTEQFYVDTLYKEFSSQGYTQAQADEAMKATYGMDVATYANKLANSINFDSLIPSRTGGVYYANKDKIYTAVGWKSSFSADTFKVSGNTLTIDSLSKAYPDLVLTKS